MSVAQLWPSMLSTIQNDAYFWGPVLNDNMTIAERALTPAVGLFPCTQVLRPMMPVFAERVVGNRTHAALSGFSGPLLGVTVGGSKGGYVPVMTYGVAAVRASSNFHVDDVGKLAVEYDYYSVEAVETTDDFAGLIGEIVGGYGSVYHVALRYFNSQSITPLEAGRTQDADAGHYDPSTFFPNRAPSEDGFREATVEFTVGSNPSFHATPTHTARGFSYFDGSNMSCAQISNGIRIHTYCDFKQAMADVRVSDSSAVNVRGLRCKMTGDRDLDIVADNFNTAVINQSVRLKACVQGVTAGRHLI